MNSTIENEKLENIEIREIKFTDQGKAWFDFLDSHKDYFRKVNYISNKYKYDENFDLFNLSRKEMIDLINNKVCGNNNQLSYLQDTRNVISLFFDHCVDIGLLNNNIFNFESYSFDIFATEYVRNNMNINYLTDNDVEDLLLELRSDDNLGKMCILLYYECLCTNVELAKIKWSDIDFDANTIKFDRNTLNISQKLSNVLKSYKNTKDSSSMNFEDYIFKLPIRSRNKEITYETYKIFVSNRPARCLKEADSKLNLSALVISGFINNIFKYCKANGINENDIYNMFSTNNEFSKLKLNMFIKRYKFKPDVEYKAKLKCYPYIMKKKELNK